MEWSLCGKEWQLRPIFEDNGSIARVREDLSSISRPLSHRWSGNLTGGLIMVGGLRGEYGRLRWQSGSTFPQNSLGKRDPASCLAMDEPILYKTIAPNGLQNIQDEWVDTANLCLCDARSLPSMLLEFFRDCSCGKPSCQLALLVYLPNQPSLPKQSMYVMGSQFTTKSTSRSLL